MRRRFFSDTSFWNTPLPSSPVLAAENERWRELLYWACPEGGFHINLHAWTMPVYDVDARTPRVRVERRFALIRDGVLSGDEEPREGGMFFRHARHRLGPEHPLGHGPGFGPEVPIPPDAHPDPAGDAHLILVDWEQGWAWDMWGVLRLPDGRWCSFTGMRYRIDGDGVFDPAWFAAEIGESIHLYGPSRASGVPAVAGLIMHDEVRAGRIAHKLAFGCLAPALLKHSPPATWTDGGLPGGIPQGTIIQLDPALDLGRFPLSPGARAVARALQEYGAVLCDFAGGATLYGEGAWAHPGMRWEGLLGEEDLRCIPFDCYRFLAPSRIIERGMVSNQHPGILGAYARRTGIRVGHG
ncbi:MAG: hypothetical protein RMM29_07665 [Planctomycetota bacterium]|nr:hypothetical protein [Planctomycetota bacterium]MDW8373505.1 hypothetical protein [Planctomycetota bacterium]